MREGWERIPLGDLCSSIDMRLGLVESEPLILSVTKHRGIIPAHTFFGKRVASRDLAAYKTIRAGEFAYSTIHIDEGAIGQSFFEFGVLSPMYTVFHSASDAAYPGWLNLLLRSSPLLKEYGARATGSINRRRSLSFSRFTEIEVLLPPLIEQRRIVDLMRAVDEYVAAADKRVETAKTARGALLADLLANPGDNWAQVPLDHVAELKLGKMLSKERATGPEQWPYLRNSNVQDGRLDLSDLKTMTFSHQDRATYSLVSGDILVCEGGDPGRSALLKEDLKGICFQKALHRVRATGVSPEFLALEIRQAYCDRRISDLCTNTTISHLTAEKFGRMRIAVPPVAEQHRIVDLMRVVDDEVTTATKVAESARHTRAALLSDLLSGNHEIPASYDRFLEAA